MTKLRSLPLVFACGLVLGCMAGGPPLTAQPPPPGHARAPADNGMPLILDRTDMRIGTTVEFDRIPDLREIADLDQVFALAHVVLSLPEWPTSYAQIQALERLPYTTDLLVLLPGYPPSREAGEAWNLLNTHPRLILLVDGPPASSGSFTDLNAMRGLERVVARMEHPSRYGFERLQRPLSFFQRIH